MHRFRPPKCLSKSDLSKTQFSSLYATRPNPQPIRHEFPSVSRSRVERLITRQTDPLLAKEIFDYASRDPNFRHSHSSYLVLILKLGRAKYLSLVDNILVRLKSQNYPLTPKLFYYILKIYGEADLPDKALQVFRSMGHMFDCRPLPRHLNCVLEILVSRQSSVKAAFELFKTAHEYDVKPNVKSYNIMMRALCLTGDLSIAYKLFGEMFKREMFPDGESYRILMEGLCRRGQVRTALWFLEDMLNKGLIPDKLSYTTLLNSLGRREELNKAYKLLCRMKVKGCNPDVVHYNTVLTAFCREGRAAEGRKILEDMESNGCLPDVVSYRTLVSGLCLQGSLDEAQRYMAEMMSKGFPPHFSVVHALVSGFCRVGRVEEACGAMAESLEHGEVPHLDTWKEIVPRMCEETEAEVFDRIAKEVFTFELNP